MTHSEQDIQVVLSEHPEVAERLIDEMDRAGRDYMRLREVEAERERLKADCETWRENSEGWREKFGQAGDDRDKWRRRAEAAEAALNAVYEVIGAAKVRDVFIGPRALEKRINAAREKGGAA